MFDKFREECGVFGIFGHPEAANLTYLGLYALQHRGQESAGIAASDGVADPRIARRWGTSTRRSTTTSLAKLPGTSRHRARPLLDRRREQALPTRSRSSSTACTASSRSGHNGNLVNAGELRDALVREGAIFQTNSDTEVVVHLFARSREAGAEAAIVDAISQVRGAFSFVMMTKDRADRRARSARLPAAGARPARRRVGRSARRPARSI